MKAEVTQAFSFGVKQTKTQDQNGHTIYVDHFPWETVTVVDPNAAFGVRQSFIDQGYEVSDICTGKVFVFSEEIPQEVVEGDGQGNVVPFKLGG